MDSNTEARVDSTQMDESQANVDQTADQLLADIVRNSDFVPNDEKSLPEEQVPELDPAETEEVETQESEEAVSEEVEEEVQAEGEETTVEDAAEEAATQESEVYSQEDLDLDAKVAVKIDGAETEVSFSDLIKGYSTEQSLSKKGRELGDARKQLEDEYQNKFKELGQMSEASLAVLYSSEKNLANQYHELEKSITEARKENDSFKMSELKDEREQIQKQYWQARRGREQLTENLQKQANEQNQKVWNEQVQYFNDNISTFIPDYGQDRATLIRDFALSEGIKEETLNGITDPAIVKFVDDYRILKQGVKQGTAKRKATPAKKAPVRKAKTVSKQKQDAKTLLRSKVLSGKGNSGDEKDFLRSMAQRSLGDI
jgi:hypothetical protein